MSLARLTELYCPVIPILLSGNPENTNEYYFLVKNKDPLGKVL